MQRALVFPYDIESVHLVRYSHLMTDINISKIVSPKGWGLCGKDASYVDLSKPLNLIVEADFLKALVEIDVVIFVTSKNDIDIEEHIYPKVIASIKSKKNIICYVQMEKAVINDLIELSKIEDVNFTYIDFHDDKELSNQPNSKLCKLSAPVVTICGNDEKSNIFDIEILLREHFLVMGYKISQIGSKDYCNLFQFNPFPKFINSLKNENDKIYAFNRYVKKIEDSERPDIIIIGIKDGVTQLSESFDSNFGVSVYEIFKAIKPDYSILSLLFNDYDASFYDAIQNSSYHKFGNMFDSFTMSNARIDYGRSEQFGRKIYSHVTLGQLDAQIKKTNDTINGLKIFNVFDNNDAMLLVDTLIETLEYNSKIHIF